MRRTFYIALIGIATASALHWTGTALADEVIRLAIQKTGTAAWELNVIRAHGLDKQADLKIESRELASPEAGKIALRAGSADMIVSDWVWVSRERSLGVSLTFYPYSSALGAIMVPADSPIRSLMDLKGKRLAVAGGALDKSWLFAQAVLRRQGIDLKRDATIAYGAPTLLAEKTVQGEMDATLNYWNICAALEARGLRRLVGIEELLPLLGASGRMASLGYTFDESWADKNGTVLTRFFQIARQAKEILATSDSEWERIAPLVGTNDPNALRTYRDRYRAGIPRRSIDDEEADAILLYRVLADIGGTALVGTTRELAPGTFYRPRYGE